MKKPLIEGINQISGQQFPLTRESQTLYLDNTTQAFSDKLQSKIQTFQEFVKVFESALDSNCSELWWQRFIIENFKFIFPEYSFPISKPNIKTVKTAFPDFLLVKPNLYADILEIKKPQTPLCTSKGKKVRPSNALIESLIQVEGYRRAALKGAYNIYNEIFKQYGCNPEFDGMTPILVIGDTRNLTSQEQKEVFEMFRKMIPGTTIITYDEIFNRSRELLNNILLSYKI